MGLLKLIFIVVLVTWVGWFPTAAAHYQRTQELALFLRYHTLCLALTAVLTPFLFLEFTSYRRAPVRIRLVFGLFLIAIGFGANVLLGHILNPLIQGVSSDWQRATGIVHDISNYYQTTK